jgi:TPR repeat protein
MMAHGFKIDLLIDLVCDRLAIMRSERMRVSGRMIVVSRMKITKAGRQALAGPASNDWRKMTAQSKTAIRAALVAFIMVAVIAGTAFAGPFENGVAAYNRGDYATAMRLWQPLADLGDPSAQNNLGVMYERDEGVPQDHVRAHMWFNLAAAQSVQTAAEGRDRVAKRMTPAQIAEAQKLAREWQPTTHVSPVANKQSAKRSAYSG